MIKDSGSRIWTMMVVSDKNGSLYRDQQYAAREAEAGSIRHRAKNARWRLTASMEAPETSVRRVWSCEMR